MSRKESSFFIYHDMRFFSMLVKIPVFWPLSGSLHACSRRIFLPVLSLLGYCYRPAMSVGSYAEVASSPPSAEKRGKNRIKGCSL